MTTPRKLAPARQPKKPPVPTCAHCRKPCGKGVVRSAHGVFCSPKHRDAARALRRAAAEPEPVDVAGAISTALALREPPATPAAFVAPPVMTDAQQKVLAHWLSTKSPDTKKSYQASAAHFAKWLVASGHVEARGHPWEQIRRALQVPEDEGSALVVDWVLAQQSTPSSTGGPANRDSIALRLSGVKSLCEALKHVGLIPHVPMFKGLLKKRQARTVIATRLKYMGVADAFFTIAEGLEALATKPDAAIEDVRDWTIIALCSQLGLRRIEGLRFELADIDLETKHIQVLGKGRDEKEPMPMGPPLVKALRRWLVARKAIAGEATSLFVSLGRGYGTGLRDRGTINRMLTRRALQFGVRLRPHDLRRIQITEAIDQLGVEAASKLARHASSATTKLYDLNAGRELEDQINAVSAAIARGRPKKKGKR